MFDPTRCGSTCWTSLDTGATADPRLFPLRATIDELLAQRTGEPAYPLVVAHTHGHGDHVAADPQFADRPATTIVGRDAEAVRDFFGFGAAWPTGEVPFELGGRRLTVLGSPGHHQAAITTYDFPLGAAYQPGERAPQLTVEQLTRVRDAAHVVAAHRGVHRFDDFLIYNELRRRDMLGLMARGLAHKAFRR